VRTRAFRLASCALLLAFAAGAALAQTIKPAQPYTVLSRDGRRSVQAATVGDQDMLRMEDLSAIFQFTVREDRANKALTVTRGGRTVVLSLDQGLASIGGRLISLAGPPVRDGAKWLVPADFVSRALGLVSDAPMEVRRWPRLILVGDVRVPRLTARVEMAGAATRLTLDVSPAVPYAVSQESRRLLIRFEADAIDTAGQVVAAQGLVEGVTAADTTTLAVALGPGFGSFKASAVALDAGSSRVLIDVMPAGAPPPPTRSGQPPLGSLGRQDAGPPPPAREPAGGIRTIVIDPGHGGDEIGARGVNGAMEKDITLDVSKRLKAVLEAKIGVRVLLTREDDRLVPLDDRAAFANNNKADLLVSIHVNASPRRDARGAEVFYLSLDGLDAETRRMTENPQGKTLPTLGGGSRDIELILWETAQARYLTESAAFAALIEEELRRAVPMSLRPIQQAAFRVLVSANMPAVLVEIGFVSNPEQEAQLTTDAYKNQVVQAILDAIVRYRSRQAGTRPDRQ